LYLYMLDKCTAISIDLAIQVDYFAEMKNPSLVFGLDSIYSGLGFFVIDDDGRDIMSRVCIDFEIEAECLWRNSISWLYNDSN